MEILLPIGFAAIALALLVFIAFRYGSASAERKRAEHDAEMLRSIAKQTSRPLPQADADVRDLLDRN